MSQPDEQCVGDAVRRLRYWTPPCRTGTCPGHLNQSATHIPGSTGPEIGFRSGSGGSMTRPRHLRPERGFAESLMADRRDNIIAIDVAVFGA